MAISEITWLHCKCGLKNCHVYSLWGVTQGQFQASKSLLPQSRSMDHWWPLFWPCTAFFGGCWSQHLNLKVQSSKCKKIKKTCQNLKSKIARCNLTRKIANDFQKVSYRNHVRWIIVCLCFYLVQDFFAFSVKLQSSKCNTLIQKTFQKIKSKTGPSMNFDQ